MATLALTNLHRSMLAEISIDGQVVYSTIDDEFHIGGTLASSRCDTAIRELVGARLAAAGQDPKSPAFVVLTDAGQAVAR